MQYPVLNKDSITTEISETRAKIPILLKGSWQVPGYGPLIVSDTYIDKVIENFNSNVLGFKPYATLGHLTDSPDPESVDGERKRGDLQEIIKEGDVVYGLYNINKETYNLIKNGDYEYSSPEIQDNFKDKITGKLVGPTLLRTALTNAPFMPFNNHKIVTLSQGSDNDIDTVNNSICIKMSTNMINEQPNIKEVTKVEIIELEPIKEIEVTKEIEPTKEVETVKEVEAIEEVETVNTPNKITSTPEITNTIETPILMSTQNEVIIPVTPIVAEAKPTVDLQTFLSAQEALSAKMAELTTKFSEALEAVSNKTTEAVNAISGKVEEISNQVNAVTTRTEDNNQYIVALSSSDNTRRLNEKLNSAFEAGASPAALNTAKAIINNFNQGNSVVKLSVSGNETELSFEDAIVNLVKLSSSAMPANDQSGTQGSVKTVSYLDTLIADNKAKAKTLAR